MNAPSLSCLAQCPPGLEPILARELADLGIRGTAMPGGVVWDGDWRSLLRANLELRVAGRVLTTLGSFRARALGELERKAGAIPWDDRLPPGPVRFRVAAARSRLNHERAVAERLARVSGREAARRDGEDGPTLVMVRIFRDEVTLRLDASGDHLHRRGYRTDVGAAPLRETLAAAALIGAGWTPDRPLVDPFCGAGTIPLEAALMARRIPPGLARAGREPRPFAFERWPGFPADLWKEVVDQGRSGILPAAEVPIRGSDRDPAMVEAATRNAERAGLAGDVRFEVAPATAAPLPSGPGWLITNPPYGGRLGERRGLRRLYAALGGAARGPWSDWGIAFLSADRILDRHLALPLREAYRTRHGGKEVRLMVHAPDPPPDIPA